MQVTLQEYGKNLDEVHKKIRPIASFRSMLSDIAAQILDMSLCYINDGHHFLEIGDLVNAVASFSYASGWLDCGYSLGFTTCPAPGSGHLSSDPDSIPENMMPQLNEKTPRYGRLLAKAVGALSYAPEPETLPFESAEKVLLVSEVYLRHGRALEEDCRLVAALVSYSYGHAWLDAGFRAGLFRVISDRDLFTV